CYAQTNYLWDATNNTYVYSSTNMRSYDNYTYIYNNTVCSSFTCTNYNGSNSLNAPSSVNTNFTWYFNSTMVKSHHYWAVIMFTGWASSTIQGFPKSTASASLNIATFGNGLNITSVNVV
ncbi:MAG TPA: hypothetical protein VGR71_10110, partial [Nitrospira sp.]|nr:hypothetical protein [Nitrospira sp.]